jgi:hypothetical protein
MFYFFAQKNIFKYTLIKHYFTDPSRDWHTRKEILLQQTGYVLTLTYHSLLETGLAGYTLPVSELQQ